MSKSDPIIALAGNPNCGKTTVFNALTGTQQKIGNWPGVTVERKSGTFRLEDRPVELVDLPGTYSLDAELQGVDEQIARDYLNTGAADVVVNIVDASSLSRGLFLTNQLCHLGVPLVVVLNMTDVAESQGLTSDPKVLSEILNCPVVTMVASRGEGLQEIRQAIATALSTEQPPRALAGDSAADAQANEEQVYAAIDRALTDSTHTQIPRKTASQRIDNIVLNRYLAFPIFLGVMYMMFFLSINVGSAFIDLFDGLGAALFVEIPRLAMNAINLPAWLTIFIADGVGGGVQLVGTFIPVIGALFLVLSLLEDSGYMARVAFIVDRLLRSLGLPGKSFVPLIVGFGCNVPAVMATRALDTEPDRILTTLMAPYMSCGARLTVYALFAAAFFPQNGQNIVFALYLIGIVVAVLSALAVRKHLLPATESQFVLELPAYHAPVMRNILLQTWQRLKGFVKRAGKAIVIVVIALNVLNSIGSDGSVGNENTENSILSAIGKSITPLFSPIGISADNWPATVGIFTGIFAKEVVVGTLDSLYAPQQSETQSVAALVEGALVSVPANLAEVGGTLLDPLGLDLGNLSDLDEQVSNQEVQINTISAMQALFDGQAGAFAYLLFILLYMPCVATIGVIFKEVGAFWAGFSVAWSTVVAYGCALIAYQLGTFSEHPGSSLSWIAGTAVVAALFFVLLIRWGKQRTHQALIPVRLLD